MKKILLPLLTLMLFTGCYTTFYPSVAQQIESVEHIPDSTRQIIINNYYESNEYYQVPRYQRYSLLWSDYYWDPFYYNYRYYHWEPYYWYGHYYYYNPRSHYWYHYRPHHHGGSGERPGRANRERIYKPAYEPLMSSQASGITPFISVGREENIITRPGKPSGVDINSGIGERPSSSSPRIEPIGKTSHKSGAESSQTNDNTIYKPSHKSSETNEQNVKAPSTNTSTAKPSRQSQSQPAIKKPSVSTSSSTKKSSSESSNSNKKK